MDSHLLPRDDLVPRPRPPLAQGAHHGVLDPRLHVAALPRWQRHLKAQVGLARLPAPQQPRTLSSRE